MKELCKLQGAEYRALLRPDRHERFRAGVRKHAKVAVHRRERRNLSMLLREGAFTDVRF